MEDLGVLASGEDHLGLEAGLEKEAVSWHRAASTVEREQMLASPTDTETQKIPTGTDLLLALAG